MDKIKLLKVSQNKRFLMKEDGAPFFWLGDTAWELFHRLNREEAATYLQNRAERNFNVILSVAIAELDGLEVPNTYDRKPFHKNSHGKYDPTMPDLEVTNKEDYTYWDHVDFIIDEAASLGLYIGLLPTWGDKYNKAWGKGPEIFNKENAGAYGEWLGRRYKDKDNIIWILGGDRQLVTARHFEIIKSMAEGLRRGDEGRHLMSFHPQGGFSSSYHNHNEMWLDFNMIQSGHDKLNKPNYELVTEDYFRLPVKPTMDGEPRYEDHPIGFNAANGYFDDFDVRQAAYWAVFAGAFGHTYGHHSVWSMCTESLDYFIKDWNEGILCPGGLQMQYLKNLIESRPFFERVPDQDIIAYNYEGANHLRATRGKDYAFIYSPNGLAIKVKMGKISGEKVKGYWYNPRKGKAAYICEFLNEGCQTFFPPSCGRRNDWVLVIDDSDKKYSTPGISI